MRITVHTEYEMDEDGLEDYFGLLGNLPMMAQVVRDLKAKGEATLVNPAGITVYKIHP